jgi:hypothetical protein
MIHIKKARTKIKGAYTNIEIITNVCLQPTLWYNIYLSTKTVRLR